MTSPRARARAALLALLLLAFALRAPRADVPPGLYHDEAWYGIDAAATAAGAPRLWYAANNGREPLFIWLAAPFVAVLGRDPSAVRWPAGLAGVVTVAAVYALTARLAGRRAALVAAALAAVAPWPVLGARVGLRAVMLPPVLTMAAAATARAAAGGRRRDAALAGALGGLTLWTYTAARLAPAIALAAWAAWRPEEPGRRRRVTRTWLAAAALFAAPLAMAVAATPGALAERPGQVALWAGEGGLDGAALARSAARTLGMFTWRGDAIVRHNLGGRPVFGPLAAGLWLVGLAVVARGLVAGRSRRGRRGDGTLGRPAAAALAAWAVALALPTALAEDAPHFLRAVGLAPWAMVVAGIGGGALLGVAAPSTRRAGLAALVLAAAVAGEARPTLAGVVAPPTAAAAAAYLGAVAAADSGGARATAAAAAADAWPGPYFPFEAGAVDLARAVAAALDHGGRGAPAPRGAGAEAAPPAVWLDRRLRDGWAAVPFLVDLGRVTLADPYDPLLGAPRGVAFVVPYGLDLDRVWPARATPWTVRLTPGPLERGDLAAAPTRMWVALERLAAAGPRPDFLARYSDGLTLESARAAPPGPLDPPAAARAGMVVVESTWRLAGAPPSTEPTAFIRLYPAAATAPLRHDAPLGAGVLPVGRWRDGDRLIERTAFAPPGGPASARRIELGLYAWPDPTPLAAVDPAGRSLAVVAIDLPDGDALEGAGAARDGGP